MAGMLAGKRILVTGAARGIGLAVAKAVTRAGGLVALTDVDVEPCQEAAQALEKSVSGAIALEMDVASQESVATTVAAAATALGGLDGVVNNAAILDECSSESVSLDRFMHVMNVNAVSMLRVVQACVPWLASSSSPAVVNTLSTQAFSGQPSSVAYASAKGAALNLTRCLAIDLAPKGIRVNGVAPGFIDTRMAVTAAGEHEHQTDWFKSYYIGARKIPLARGGTPEDCAGAFLFLLSEMSAYITGHVILVDGGLSATY